MPRTRERGSPGAWLLFCALTLVLGFALPRTSQAQCSSSGWSFSPCSSSITVAPGGSATRIISIQNNTPEYDGTNLSCTVTAPVTDCSVTPNTISLNPGRGGSLTVSITVGMAPGTGTVVVTSDFAASSTINVTVPAAGPPVSAAATPTTYRNPALCVASCFDATYAYSTPAYTSLDVARSLTIAYRSSLAHAMALVTLDAQDTTASGARQMSVQLWHNGSQVSFTNGTTESFFSAGPGNNRLTVQYDASSIPTGVSNDSVVVTSYLNDGTTRSTGLLVRSPLLNGSDSPIGVGWTIVGIPGALIQPNGDIVVTNGTGAVSYYSRPAGCAYNCAFVAPNGEFRTLTGPNQMTGNYSLRSPDGVTATFTGGGQVTAVVDRFGNATQYGYTNGYLTTITDPAGQVTTLAYGPQPSSGVTVVQSITTPGGRVTNVTIDAAGNLTRIDGPDGQPAFRGDYAAGHYLTHWLDRNGNDWNVTYDGASRLASLIAPTVTADGASVRPTVTYTSIESGTIAMPGAGTGMSSNPVPRVDTAALRARVMNPRGYATAYKLDKLGAPAQIEEPLGRVTQITRDYADRVSQVHTPSGDVQTFGYDGPDLTATLDGYTGRAVYMEYEPTYHQLTRVYGDADSVWNYWSGGKLDSTRTGTSARPVTRFSYDSRGRMTQSIDPAGHYTNVFYASSGWQNTDSTRAVGRTSSQHFNSSGLVDRTTDPAGNSAQTSYDGLGRVQMTIGPRNDTTVYSYTGNFLTTVQDAKHQSYQFAPNALGWTVQQTNPRGTPTYLAYDRNGNVTSTTNRRGQVITATYDALDQLTSRSADGATTTYAADPLGLYFAGSNGESTDTVKYDPAGRAVSEITVRSGTRYERQSSYNVRDQRTGANFVTQPWGWALSAGYHYNAAMQLDTLTDMAGGKTVIAYDALDQPVSTTLPNGLVISSPFANVSRPGSLGYNNTAVNASQGASYAYGSRGELTDQVAPSGASGREFHFDAAGQVAGLADYTFKSTGCYTQQMPPDPPETVCPPASKSYGSSVAYSYDQVGNFTWNNALTDTGDRLTRFGGDSLVFDADGNVVTRIRYGAVYQTLSWDAIGQLTSVTTNGSTVSFGYDAFGRRIRKSTPSWTSSYFHDGDNIWAVADQGGTHLVQIYTYYPGVDQPHSIFQGGAISYYLQDALGNVTGLVDNAQNLQNQYTYLPFGGRLSASETVTNYLQFAAREYDSETGLYYMRARYYDPNLGRFLSEDPLGLAAGINPYLYAGNDPVNGSDPSGLCAYYPEGFGHGRNMNLGESWTSPRGIVYRCTGDADEASFFPESIPVNITASKPDPNAPTTWWTGYSLSGFLGVGANLEAGGYYNSEGDWGLYSHIGGGFGGIAEVGSSVTGGRMSDEFAGGSVQFCQVLGRATVCKDLTHHGASVSVALAAVKYPIGSYVEFGYTSALPISQWLGEFAAEVQFAGRQAVQFMYFPYGIPGSHP